MEPRSEPETPRTGKYCPRCRAMAPRDQAVCRQCGHQFRSGPEQSAASVAAPSTAPDPLHRTMQFVLPPLRPNPAPEAPAALPDRLTPGEPRLLWAAALLGLLLCAGLAFLWHVRRPPPPVTPVGAWETTLHGKASANAHLEFLFRPGGGGQFSWRETGPAALSGQTPLRWTLNPDKTLSLALNSPAGDDAISQTLAGIFSGHAWIWHIDPAPRRLVLGSLVFTEKR